MPNHGAERGSQDDNAPNSSLLRFWRAILQGIAIGAALRVLMVAFLRAGTPGDSPSVGTETLFSGAALGAIGGAVAWLIGERPAAQRREEDGRPAVTVALAGMLGALAGACLGGVQAITFGLPYEVRFWTLEGGWVLAAIGLIVPGAIVGGLSAAAVTALHLGQGRCRAEARD